MNYDYLVRSVAMIVIAINCTSHDTFSDSKPLNSSNVSIIQDAIHKREQEWKKAASENRGEKMSYLLWGTALGAVAVGFLTGRAESFDGRHER